MAEIEMVTFNCRSVRKNVHVVRNLCDRFKLIALQETFLPQQEGDFLNSISSKFTCVSSSPVDLGRSLIRGRPYGGLAFLIHEEITPFVKKVSTNDERLLCIDIVFNGTKI